MKLPLTIIALALSLTACHNYTNDYVNAKSMPALKAPPGVDNPTFVNHNPIPAPLSSTPVSPPSLVPPGLMEDEAAAKIALAEAKAKTGNSDNTKNAKKTEGASQQS